MADVKISQLPAATTPLAGTEEVPLVQGGTTKKVTVTNLRGTAGVTSVTGTAPVVSSGGTTPAISMPSATTSRDGYLTSADWNTFNGKQPAGSYLTSGGALGTPSSGTATNLTGLPLTTGVTGLLPVANGGTGTATPALVAGTNVTITGTWPNQTINSTGGSGGGDVTGPGSSTDNAVARFDSTTGKIIQNSGVLINDTGEVTVGVWKGTEIGLSYGGTGASTASQARGNILPAYAGNAGKVLAVNTGATDVEYISAGGTGTVTSVDVSGGTTGLTTSGGPVTAAGTITLAGTLAVANGGTGVTTSTGTGNVVLSNSPTLVTPALGTPASGVVTNLTGTASININGTVGATTPSTGVFTGVTVNDNTILGSSNTDTATFNARVASEFTPSTNNAYDLGRNSHEWRNLYLSGTANITTLSVSGIATLGTGAVLNTPASATLTNATGLPLSTGVTGTLPVANGGTGATSLTANNVILGNGTSPVQVVAPGSSGNVLTSNGTTWTSVPGATGDVTLTGTQTLTNKTIEAGTFTNGYTEETVTANTGTAYTIDLANGSVQILTLTGNCTFTFPTATAGRSFTLLLRQDGTGSRTVTWSANVRWPGGTAPTITSTASRQDKYIFTADGTNWYGSNAGQNYTV